ncbi:MAG TPA: asparagine synthase (glutamine-hydrolyzing) [Phycisphaerae bacterium]|nr:asparagine synthase (glutamine-hydrolyzing) [Phycisphaerae bacterium]
MCGIVGGISIEPFSGLAESGRLDAAIDTLAHRGPDDRSRATYSDGRAFFGHRRLSIIDVAGGHQPLSNETGTVHAIYNGEIYNYRALRDALAFRGHEFRTQTDGEVVVHLYEDKGADFVRELSGMFAVAIYDETARKLTLARDRNGIKPLYYFHDGRSLIFGSELKAILALLPARPRLSAHALAEYLRWKYVPAPWSIYEGIHKLPPGHVLRAGYDEGRIAVETRRYWDVDYGVAKLSDEREAIEQLDAKLRAAVKSHLESDVEVGALLSGGVDSSLVVALACDIGGRPIKTFSVGFEEEGFDQLPFARLLANRYGTVHHEEHVRLDPMQAMPLLVRQFDEPFADSSALACYAVCQVAAKHVKVALTGDGGDESFAGYGRYEEVLTAQKRSGIWRGLRDRAIISSSSALVSPEAKYLKRFRHAALAPLERHEQHQRLCSDWLLNKLLTNAYAREAGPNVFGEHRDRATGRGWSAVDVAQYVDLHVSLPDDMLTKVDRTSMACSLECRVPLLDHTITEFSASLATDLKIRGGVRKYLLKKLAERYVPRELLYRPKMGFRIPIRRWLKRGLLAQTEALVVDGALVGHGIIDPQAFHWMVRQQGRPWIDFGSQLWGLLFLEQWAREYLGE